MEQIERLRKHFDSGALRPLEARRKALRSLRTAIGKHEEELLAAMHADMRKPRFEAYLSDIGLVLGEIDLALKELTTWARPERVATPLAVQVAETTVLQRPLGVVLIVAPWNYPVLLLLSPLVGAIAAGNCAVLKPSEEVPATSAVVARIIAEAFDPEHVLFVQGPGHEVVPALMANFRFDHVFFTGSPRVGRSLLAAAAAQLVPVTLELGGKSPAIVDRRCDVKVAAERIAWSKYFNAGQTCIATDHALVHHDVMDAFLSHFERFVRKAYGADAQQSPHYARMVNDARFRTVHSYVGQGTVRFGGVVDAADRYIAPTVLTDVSLDATVMREEIFGPVLPVLPWTEREEVLGTVARNPDPLATYLFSSDRKAQAWFLERIASGGGCINHCMLQFAPHGAPFGGVGNSGMGRYHGKHTFQLFSHSQSVVHASTLIDHGLQAPPYSSFKERVLRVALRPGKLRSWLRK